MQIGGEEVEAVTDFILLGSKITADDDCNHKIKRRLLLGRKTMTNLDSVLRSKDITLLTKVHIIKAMVFSSSHVWGFPGSSAGRESTCNAEDTSSVSGWGRAPGGGHGNPFQYSCLENPHGQRSLAGYNP